MEKCKGGVPEDVYVDDVLVKCHKYTGNEDTLLFPILRLSEEGAEL